MQRAVKVKALCNVPVFAGAFFFKVLYAEVRRTVCRRRSERAFLSAFAFPRGAKVLPAKSFSTAAVFLLCARMGQRFRKNPCRANAGVFARRRGKTLHAANAAVRRFERAFGATLKGRFANAAEGQFFAAVFLPGQSGFSPLRRLVFSKASAPHGACRQTRKAFFRGRSGRFLRRRKKLGDFHSNLCLCVQKSLNFFEICLNFFQITIEKYLSVC